MKTLAPFALVGLFARLASAVTSIEIQGSQFVNPKTNERFVIVGVDYQPGGASGYDEGSGKDPLSDKKICLRDAALMQQLGTNTIRVYNVNVDLNHDDCMSIFNEVGIYVILDVNTPLGGQSLAAADPSGSYTESYLKHIFSAVDAFKGYPNLLGFFAGNEVVNDVKSAEADPPYIRAVTRDLKQYIKKNAQRAIPVGYSAADSADGQRAMWAYLTCGDDDDSKIDFFGLNSYSWCGQSTFQDASYDKLVNTYNDTTVPVFFSEYGCNKPAPRIFQEVTSIYGSDMLSVWSGGLVYEYSQEADQYGLVSINDNNTASLLADYNTLQGQLDKIDQSVLTKTKTSGGTTQQCSKDWIITESSASSTFNTSTNLPDSPGSSMISGGSGSKNIGKIVSVSDTNSPYSVFNVSGTQLNNLAVKPLSGDESNTPGSSNSNSSGSGDKKSAAHMSRMTGSVSLVAGLAAVFFLVL